MKKYILVVTIILLLLLLALPGAVGMVAEKEFRKLSTRLDSEAAGLRLAVEEYERGWFTSRARYRLSLGYPTAGRAALDELAGVPSLVSDAEIFHGPIPFASLGGENASLWPVIARSVDRVSVILGDGKHVEVPARVTTRLAILGKHSHNISVERFTHEFDNPGESGKLVWDGMTLDSRFNTDLSTLELQGKLGAIDIDTNRFHLRAGPATLSSNQERSGYGVWTGDARVRWDGLRLETPETMSVSMGAFTSEVSSGIKAGMFDQDIEMTLSELGVDGWKGGPGRLSLALEKLDARAVGELAKAMRDLALAESKDANAAADLMPAVFPQLQALLAGGPHLALSELSFETPDGKVMFSADLAFPESTPAAAFGFLVGLTGVAELRFPAALFERMGAVNPEGRAQLQALFDAGFLVRNQNSLVLDAALKGGLLTVNGQPLPLPLGL